MLNSLFTGLFDTTYSASAIDVFSFCLCIAVSLFLGVILCGTYMLNNRPSKSFLLTLIVLPAVVCVVIMMVNGNVGAGVAVAGAFSLVRFRSQPGTAAEITMLFLAMGAGLIAGMGYIGYAVLFTLILCLIFAVFNAQDFGINKKAARYKNLRVTIPEDLDYTNVFDDIFQEYAKSCELTSVKTTNMGSMFRLSYDICMNDPEKEKEMIDKIRCRNGNLEISISRQESLPGEL